MGTVFTSRISAVMTCRTGAWRYSTMAEVRRRPTQRRMTGIARFSGWYVISILTRGNRTVMASRTLPWCYAVMAEVCRRPTVRSMASVTRFGGW